MVSDRCRMFVKDELLKLGLHYNFVDIGEVDIIEDISPDQKNNIKQSLKFSGLELIDDKKSILIEKIKSVIIEMVHFTNEIPKSNFSDYLSSTLKYDYTYLANIFSEIQGITIEKYIIYHKIERVKELISYNEISLTEIAWKMHYSSVAHLSNQFKKLTGFTPSQFKHLQKKNRTPIEKIGNT